MNLFPKILAVVNVLITYNSCLERYKIIVHLYLAVINDIRLQHGSSHLKR